MPPDAAAFAGCAMTRIPPFRFQSNPSVLQSTEKSHLSAGETRKSFSCARFSKNSKKVQKTVVKIDKTGKRKDPIIQKP
jgi:hypothetical protein